ncbi:MAG: DUF2157 domain-containing protein [Erythrobacter sp.]|jgi:uncharacterized membrane protein|uniref:DUF2157 domain-containing protein n=1 Tax=Erythrobacter sp. TaxID=1042 RepID=UPI002B464DAC|nr:DUF2157 domain-containing protein [Erythrobacter sp.]WRH69800.1 MAG: DUF2157 domain-containing protein [Erythrobacter sp.]
MSTRKIAAWHAAGLIDADTRDAILAYETAHARPLALWAVFGIGALAIGLGIVSVIAANWEDIPGQLRLGVHLALIAAGLAVLFLREEQFAADSPWAVEALVFVTAALGLTFFGHLGQVYQTSSPLWKPLAAWLALFVPLLLLTGRSWPSALAVLGGAVWCAWDYAAALTGYGAPDPSLSLLVWTAFLTALPVAFAPIAAALRARSLRPDFWRRLEQIALAYGVAGASLATAFAASGAFGEERLATEWASMATSGAVALAAGLATIALRPGISGRMSGAIMAGAGLIPPLAYLADGFTMPAALLFMALWAGIAAAALAAHWRGVFQLAVAAIALRLIILSFELASDLLLSGFGLILSGLLILGVAWVAVRVSKAFAPPADDAEDAA